MPESSLLWSLLNHTPSSLLSLLSKVGSELHYFFDKKHVTECERILELTKIKVDKKKSIKKMYAHLWKILPEMIWASKVPNDVLSEKLEGFDDLKKYYQNNFSDRGVLFVSAHLGSWELTSLAIARMITPVICIYKPHKYKWVNRFIIKARSQEGQKTIAKDGSIVKIFKHIKRGGSAGMVIDQHGGENGVPSQFLGKPCLSWDIMATLSSKCKCPIIPVATIRKGDHFKYLWAEAILPVFDENGKLDVKKTTLLIDSAISKFVEEAPDQWMWLGKRWGRNFENLMQGKS